MSERRTARDVRRRQLGQNFLADRSVVDRFVGGIDLGDVRTVVELGAGTGASTVPLARLAGKLGVAIWAVEADPHWAARLTDNVRGLDVRVVRADLRSIRLPSGPYVVVANLPFGVTSDAMSLLFDNPEHGPLRAELIVQREVALKHATSPPAALRSAAWAPWWTFEMGATIGRRAFRPIPRVDAAVLTVRRRDPPVLPFALAPRFRETLRDAWSRTHDPKAARMTP